MQKFPIDVVIAWVDGKDPEHRKKRQSFMNAGAESLLDEIGGDTRFNSVGEIFFCVASVLRFATFVRKIYIVTDNQDPGLSDFLERNFPNRTIDIELVDHKILFKGYEKYLPVFNSLAIETMLWRIPGLSEHFIYMNDDFTLMKPLAADDFFAEDGTPVAYAQRFPRLFVDVLRLFKPARHGIKPLGFKDSIVNGARLIGHGLTFIYIGHTPYSGLKSFFEKFYKERPENILLNISHRFRHAEQYNVFAMEYSALERGRRLIIKPYKDVMVVINPRGRGLDYLKRKFREIAESSGVKFCCINSLDRTSPEEIEYAGQWMARRLGVSF